MAQMRVSGIQLSIRHFLWEGVLLRAATSFTIFLYFNFWIRLRFTVGIRSDREDTFCRISLLLLIIFLLFLTRPNIVLTLFNHG